MRQNRRSVTEKEQAALAAQAEMVATLDAGRAYGARGSIPSPESGLPFKAPIPTPRPGATGGATDCANARRAAAYATRSAARPADVG
jgi:hypothetical protein